MAAVQIPHVHVNHVAQRPEDGRDEEEDLGIYEDNTECADLTDSELEDIDHSQISKSSKRQKSLILDASFGIIAEEDESHGYSSSSERRLAPQSVEQGDFSGEVLNPLSLSEHRNVELKLLDGADSLIPSDLKDECPGVRTPPNTTLPGYTDKSLVSFSQTTLLDKPSSIFSGDMMDRSGTRGKANTPVSFLTEVNGPESGQMDSRATSGVLGLESREAMYKQAMNIMSSRCLTTQMEENAWLNPFGIPDPEYFYIEQQKPTPMPPLKAWRGYNGNVYFEPIKVSSVGGLSEVEPNNHKTRSRISYSDIGCAVQSGSRSQVSPFRSTSQPTQKYPVKVSTSINKSGNRQMSVLDKTSVLNRFNNTIHEDLVWIEGQENTGTLAVNSRRKGKKSEDNTKPYRDRVCKGLVSHKQAGVRKKKLPELSVLGDKFIPPPSTSPLLRTLTQYSLSTTRVANNSPEHGYEKLPPLEQMKATLRSINNSHEDPYRKPLPRSRHSVISEEYIPLVKYSPEVKARYQKHRTK